MASKKIDWGEALEFVIGHQPPPDTLELRNDFIEGCLLDRDGKPITQGQIHEVMQDAIYRWTVDQSNRRNMIMAPYNSGKSQQFPIALLVYLSTRNPELEHLIVSADKDLAGKRVTAIRDMIESKEYKFFCKQNDLKPLELDPVKDNGANSKVYFKSRNRTGNPSIEASGVMTGGTGQRAMYLWLDDICSDKDRGQPKYREKVYQRVQNVWIKRLHDDGKIIGVCTPYHEEDANMRFCASGTFNVLKIAVNSNKDGYIVEEYEVDYGHE